jgi:peptidoglycan/xylan/chitin deacetylase (PgdA/CDA1 family)
MKGKRQVRLDKRAARLLACSGLLPAIERAEARSTRLVRILVYHRVGDGPDQDHCLDPGLISTTPEMFARQMAFLKSAYHCLSIDELLEALRTGRGVPPRSVMVTFDDGYRDFLELAWPVLHWLQIPSLLFVATDHMEDKGSLYWWDRLYRMCFTTARAQVALPGVGTYSLESPEARLHAYRALRAHLQRQPCPVTLATVTELERALDVEVAPVGQDHLLTWDEVRALSDAGVAIGAHTRTHAIVSCLPLAQVRDEIAGAQEAIQRHFGQTWPVFAYPRGHAEDIGTEVMGMLDSLGFEAAMTMIQGHNILGRTPPMGLRRVGIASHLTMEEFRLVLTRVCDIHGALLSACHSVGAGRHNRRLGKGDERANTASMVNESLSGGACPEPGVQHGERAGPGR